MPAGWQARCHAMESRVVFEFDGAGHGADGFRDPMTVFVCRIAAYGSRERIASAHASEAWCHVPSCPSRMIVLMFRRYATSPRPGK